MNCVVLCGRLAGRPKSRYTPGGLAVAEFRLLVSRERQSPTDDEPAEPVDCVAFRTAAQDLVHFGEPGDRVNLSGMLRQDRYVDPAGCSREGLRVHAERAYFVDPPVPPPHPVAPVAGRAASVARRGSVPTGREVTQ
jgi:single-stranded DNA-binding protein